MTTDKASVRPPTTAAERSLAPDLARGAMLLLIALANAPWYLYGQPPSRLAIHSPDGSLADKIVQAVTIIAVDSRTYPMFAFLFGYGIVQLYQRQVAAGTEPKAARQLLRRRHWWLVTFGLLHCALLWVGDILLVYGLVGLVIVGLFFKRRDVTLLAWSALLLVINVAMMAFGAYIAFFTPRMEGPPPEAVFDPFHLGRVGIADPQYLPSILERLSFVPFLVIFQGFVTLAIPIALLLAFWAARHRVLEEPEKHRPLLRRTAVIGIGLGWVGGAVCAMQHFGAIDVPDLQAELFFHGVQVTTGLLCGIGYVALFGLIKSSRTARVLAAVGKRSLSSYLAQSVLFAPLLSAWGLGLGAKLSSWSVAVVAVACWLVTVALANAMERSGRRGPAEVALRRLAYGRPAR